MSDDLGLAFRPSNLVKALLIPHVSASLSTLASKLFSVRRTPNITVAKSVENLTVLGALKRRAKTLDELDEVQYSLATVFGMQILVDIGSSLKTPLDTAHLA